MSPPRRASVIRFGCVGAVIGALCGIYTLFVAIGSGPNFEPPSMEQMASSIRDGLRAEGGRPIFTIALLIMFGAIGAVPGGILGALVGWLFIDDRSRPAA